MKCNDMAVGNSRESVPEVLQTYIVNIIFLQFRLSFHVLYM